MTLANVAWILAANGHRVLVADWDLESPGLHRFYQPFLDADVAERPGIVDFIRRYEYRAKRASTALAKAQGTGTQSEDHDRELKNLIGEHVNVQDYAVPLNWRFPGEGALSFISAGRQNRDYQTTLTGLDWDTFYEDLYGAWFFDALRTEMKQRYDYVLIDSRTGLSDVAAICTVHMPDTLVDCFTLSTQGIEGAAMIADQIQRRTDRNIRILPVPMRIDPAENERSFASLMYAAHRFERLPAGLTDAQRRDYWASVRVPYEAFYSFEETLAIFGDMAGSPTSLLSSFERITAQVTAGAVSKLPPMDEQLRLDTKERFSRKVPTRPLPVVLDFSPEDQLWAEWIESTLMEGGIPVYRPDIEEAEPGNETRTGRTIAVVTTAYVRHLREQTTSKHPDLAVSLTGARLPYQLTDVPVVSLAGLTENEAIGQLLGGLGGRQRPGNRPVAVRYPLSDQPQLIEIPGRNPNFTGREKDLRNLREQLREHGTAVILAIQGMGGVGKTQVALEYAHRFRADYDLIWWMNCGQSQYVDSALIDLGDGMRTVLNAGLPEADAAEAAGLVLELLSENPTDLRWLLVYDNADEIEEIQPLLPTGNGHVLITSRNRAWPEANQSLPIDVDVFTRPESVRHLQRRNPGISAAEADQVAEAVGDLPLAVATAGAWLADTGTPVPEYLELLQQRPPHALRHADFHEYQPQRHRRAAVDQSTPAAIARPVPDEHAASERQIWDPWSLSLDRLQETSKAGARLLELCSVMAPDISLTLIYSQAMANLLARTDSSITEPLIIGRLVRRIDRLALIKLDNAAHQIQVHRLVQAVIRERLGPEKIKEAQSIIHGLMVAVRPEGEVDDPEAWSRYRMIWPHLTPSEAMWSTDEQVRSLLIDRVRYLRQRSDLERGQRRADEIEAAWEVMLSREPVGAETSLAIQLPRLRFNKANILRDLAQFTPAIELDRAVLKEQQQVLPPDHPHILLTQGSLTGDLRALGEYAQALELARQTHEAWDRDFGESYSGTLAAAHNLAVSLRLTGQYETALTLDTLTGQRRASTLGSTHPRTLDSGSAVVRDLIEMGQYDEAVSQMEEVLAESRKSLGDDDRATLNAKILLGVATRSAGDPDKAQPLLEDARRQLARGFGDDSTDALAARLSLAINLMALRKFAEARSRAESVRAIYYRRLGATHPQSLICQLDVATALSLQGLHEPALVAAQQANQGLEKRLGGDHPYALAARMTIAAILASQPDLDEAGRLEERVAEALERVLGPSHPDTLRCQANLLLTRSQLGVAGSAELRTDIIRRLAAQIGQDHPDVAALSRGTHLLRVIDPQPF